MKKRRKATRIVKHDAVSYGSVYGIQAIGRDVHFATGVYDMSDPCTVARVREQVELMRGAK